MLRSSRLLLEAIGASPSLPAVAVGLDGDAPSSFTTVFDDWRMAKLRSGLHHDLVPPGPWATILFDPHGYEPGHGTALLTAAAGALLPTGQLLCTPPPRYPAEKWLEALRERFRRVEEESGLYRAAEGLQAPPEPVSMYESFGCRFETVAGIFSPRGVDPGTALMLEALLPQVAGRRLLDLGCGAGVVGVAAAQQGADALAVDISARALRITAQNAAANGVALAVRPSDGLADLGDERFDLIATNPPFHEDFGVARRFVEGAHERLALGGSLYLVVRRAGWYAQKLRAVFGGYRLVERDGYSLFVAERREGAAAGRSPRVAPTRKHQKRMEEAARRRKRR